MARRSAIGIFNGNWKNRWRRDLEDGTSRGQFIIEKNKLAFGDALCELKSVDPHWEEWFDDDANIPPVIYWSRSDEIQVLCEMMLARAKVVRDAKELPRS